MSINEYPVIVLKENEMFRNAAGEVCSVDVRGERTYDKCFFSVKDIGHVFGVKRLEHDILQNNNYDGYIVNIIGVNNPKQHSEANRYFNYFGLIKWIMSSRKNELAIKYSEWMMKTLFTVQFGKNEDKEELIKTLEGTDIKNYKLAMGKCVNKIKCVYLFTIGTVRDLRKSMNISKEYKGSAMVVKYGLSKNLEKRFQQHKTDYEKYEGSNIKLEYYALVDASRLYDVETKIRKEFAKYRLDVEGRNELLCMTESHVKSTKDYYTSLVDDEQSMINKMNREYKEKTTRKINKYLLRERAIHQERVQEYKNELQKTSRLMVELMNENRRLKHMME